MSLERGTSMLVIIGDGGYIDVIAKVNHTMIGAGCP